MSTKKQIFIFKTGVYDPLIAGLDKYDSYELVTTQQYSPPITRSQTLEKIKLHIEPKIKQTKTQLFCSYENRTFETARLFSESYFKKKLEIVSLYEINEIKFSLKSLLTKTEYDICGSNLVRERFIEHFIKDQLLESRRQIEKRMKSFLKRVQLLPEGQHIFFSHSFYMKLLQIYLDNRSLFSKSTISKEAFDPTRRTFDCCEGFEIRM